MLQFTKTQPGVRNYSKIALSELADGSDIVARFSSLSGALIPIKAFTAPGFCSPLARGFLFPFSFTQPAGNHRFRFLNTGFFQAGKQLHRALRITGLECGADLF